MSKLVNGRFWARRAIFLGGVISAGALALTNVAGCDSAMGTPTGTGGTGQITGAGGKGNSPGTAGSTPSAAGTQGGSAGTGGTSAPACNATVTAGAIPLSDQYGSVIADGGYAYAYDDGMGSTACVDTTAFCATGTTAAATSTSIYGSGIGIHLNQVEGAAGVATPINQYAVTGSGITYAVSNLPPQGLRIDIDDDGGQYCAVLSTTSGTVPWSAFNSKCWDNTGMALSGAPTEATLINFQVPATSVAESFNFCVTSIAFAPPASVAPVGIGSACRTAAGCSSGDCSTGGWCTSGCTTNVQCGINAYGALDWCVENGAGVDVCFPGCASTADCAIYGSGATCQETIATNGAVATICAAP